MICEKCGKEHDGSFGSGRFCSRKCSNIRTHTNVSKEKISKKLKEKVNPNRILANGKIIVRDNIFYKKCPICGREYLFVHGNNSRCENQFCIEHKHNIQQFKSLIKYFKFDKSKLGTNEVEDEFNRIKDILYDMYWNKHMSSSEICKIFNYPSAANLTNKLFKNILFIPVKTCKECIKENYLYGRLNISENLHTFANQQWYTTWNNKEVYLRSSHELEYAKKLDEKQIDYEVENLRIKYWDSQKEEFRCAIPDFYIPSENLIVEIKSKYTLDKQNMIDKKKAYIDQGYKFKLICDHIEIEI